MNIVYSLTVAYSIKYSVNRPKTYAKGPDIASKSRSTQYCHKDALKGQQSLSMFNFGAPASGTGHTVQGYRSASSSTSQPTLSISPLDNTSKPRARSSTILSDPSEDSEQDVILLETLSEASDTSSLPAVDNLSVSQYNSEVDEDFAVPDELLPPIVMDDHIPISSTPNAQVEDWEEDFEEFTSNPPSVVKSWDVLKAQIEDVIKKGSKSLSTTQRNHYLILSHFATLRMKGVSCGKVSTFLLLVK